jgi:hypothetical protein
MLKTIDSDCTVIRCDCGACNQTVEGLDFDDVRESAKSYGWIFRKNIDGWQHFAPGHKEYHV